MSRRLILLLLSLTKYSALTNSTNGTDVFTVNNFHTISDSANSPSFSTTVVNISQSGSQDGSHGTDASGSTKDRNGKDSNNLFSKTGQTLSGLLPLLYQNQLSFDWNSLMPMLFEILQQQKVSDACKNDVSLLIGGIHNRDIWAMQMLDSIFKIPSNVLSGNLLWLGDKHECEGVKALVNNTEHFVGKYCTLVIPADDFVPDYLKASGKTSLRLGTCASSSCSETDIYTMIKILTDTFSNGTVKPVVSCTADMKLQSDVIVVICILCVLGALVVIGTIYDVIAVQLSVQDNTQHEVVLHKQLPPSNVEPDVIIGKQIPSHKQRALNAWETVTNSSNVYLNGAYVETDDVQRSKPPPVETDDVERSKPPPVHVNKISYAYNSTRKRKTISQVLLSFSVYTNGCKLLNTDQGTGSLGSVNGIRFLSMAWVILGHTLFFAIGYDANMSPMYYGEKMSQWTFMAIQYATVSVDSFFALSGILVAYLTLRELNKCGGAMKLNWFMFYFHRFWRLTPPYMLVIMVGTVLFPYIVRGPMSSSPGDYTYMQDCRTNWWTNLLYVNNYVNVDKGCMAWTWYLANDMQMYIVSPLVLLPFFYNFIAGSIVCGLLMAATIASNVLVVGKHHYPVQTVPGGPLPDDNDYYKRIYMASYARLAPYLMGLFTGYLLYRTKCKLKIPKVVNLVGWFLCIVINILIIYGPYTDMKTKNHIFSQAESTAYLSVFRLGYGVVVCWIVVTCTTGYGGWINQMLSWKPFVPLGRLTYCAYLVHPLVMGAYYGTRDTAIYISDYDLIYLFLGNIVMAYGTSFIVSLVFESPMMGLEKAIFKK